MRSARLIAIAAICAFATAADRGAPQADRASPGKDRPAQPVEQADRPIAPQDLLVITVVGEQNLPPEFRVSGSGIIEFPYVGRVEAKGLTPSELGAKLRDLLAKDYFVDPQVIVTVREYRQDFVYVIGEVNRPGPVAIPAERKLSIVEAIAFANGTTRLAKNKVEYTHKGVTKVLSLDDVKKVTDPEKRVWLEPGDIIEIKESAF